ncbi:hypothetical protein KDE13_00175 [Campylobacter sp. faydin G-140]|uniref:hypothetical protein n=1 Tax=Campylobacter anatolicus TaxID=2829105 RepID=UPI001BA19267|nr:hypothetical protein [Campylobacter anatolicus]MBR8464775.1 hypothetical protein [Campylobacter anatolicus]
MKLTFNGSFAIIRPFGFLESDLIGQFLHRDDIMLLEAKKPICILLSLKDVTFFTPVWFGYIIDKLNDLSKGIGARIGVCDYSDSLYELMIKTCYKLINFSLFQTEQIATLFVGDRAVNGSEILLFHDSLEQRSLIELKLNKRGYKVKIETNLKEFLRLKDKYLYAIDQKTKLFYPEKFLQIFTIDSVVIYRINGLIDSDFVSKFDSKMHQNLLKTGYKFFIFWVNITSAMNALGADFLINLSKLSSKYNSIISICGLNQNSISAGLVDDMQRARILLYKNLQEFYGDNAVIYINKNPLQIPPSHITKNIVEILPNVIKFVFETISTLSKSEMTCLNTKIQTYALDDELEYIRACVLFYGDFDMRLMVGVRKYKIAEICKFFSGKDEVNLAEYEIIFGIIINKILKFFVLKGMSVAATIPKFFDKEHFFDITSKGALTLMSDKNDDIAVIFVSK